MGHGEKSAWQFWIDRGGTFTDIVARAPDGALHSRKLLSDNPERYRDAAVAGVRDMLGLDAHEPIPTGRVEAVKMGTTVATNALLERRGEPTVLVITQGFGDLLRIGYQNRPRLFDLDIKLPDLIYDEVIEAPERVSVDGEIIKTLDQDRVRRALQAAYAKGFRAVAVALMHGYRHPRHEQAIGELARSVGFSQVSLSHETSPLIKLVSRGDTTVVDAYLSPILRRYVNEVSDALGADQGGCDSLMFMQSNGGLTDAEFFQGKDAILSGPAGGVVGMVRTAECMGFDRLIGFDMGGTSTDVCHYAGEYERSLETEVAGVRMRAPMMSIHTVAAGGGSVLEFEHGRLQVGPHSAGAIPGPASYRRGGPLAVTDCNVVLGKLQPDRFPHVFGPNGDEPLDVAAARSQFEALSARIARETGAEPMSVEALAEGFLRIAVENMANAIKKISVQRGHDVTEYTLNCFGGAGGQHACGVADLLGMQSIYIHPLAGVLSAFGMGVADVRAVREHQFGGSVNQAAEAGRLLDDLAASARDEVRQQGVPESGIRVILTAHLRVAGSHQILPVPFSDPEEMQAAFDAAHQQRFGFIPNGRDRLLEIVSAEAVGSIGEMPVVNSEVALSPAEPQKARMFSGGEWRSVPVLERNQLQPSMVLEGPAIITDPTGTTVVEAGWQARELADGALELRRVREVPRSSVVDTSVDPVMLEVFSNLFMSIAEQMGSTLANTAHSVNIKERYDFSCALFDANGDLVANAPHVPVHLGSMSESVRSILRDNAGKIRPGDVFMMNDPYSGGTHLPDMTVITPVFDAAGEEIVFWTASRGHHADIGGKTPGSGPPDSRHIDEEGVLIRNFLLLDQGRFKEAEAREFLSQGRYPCRNIDENMADLAAQVAANETGVRELYRIVREFGLEVVQAYMGHVQDNAEESVRRVLDVLKDSSFSYPLDSGATIAVAISVNHAERTAHIDFSGTSSQDPFNYNAPFAVCRAVVLYVFRTLVGADIPMNEGCLKPISIHAPEGSMINPNYPAAVISGNTEVSQAIAEALYGALGVMAGSQGTMNNFIYGNGSYQNYETIGGGTGAGPGFNGTSAVHSHMTNTRMTDPEVLENRFPVRVEEFAIRQGAGGQGQWQGGDGIRRRLRFLESATATVLSSHRRIPPHGLGGGEPGRTGRNYVERSSGARIELDGNDEVRLTPGDVFVIETPGGGGYGSPNLKD